MKKILTVCIMLAAIVFLAYAGTEAGKITVSKDRTVESATPVSKTVDMVKPLDSPKVMVAEVTLDGLMAQIRSAKASGNAALLIDLEKKYAELRNESGSGALDACDDCLTPNANLGDIVITPWATIAGDFTHEGKWYASFIGYAGATYHWDLCNPGSASADLDIKIADATCIILVGKDGSSDCNWNPVDWTWACTANGTYYVEICPYNFPQTEHYCGGTTETFTLAYYRTEVPTTGSCCYADGTCEVLSESQCAAMSGTFTLGGVCEPNTCPQPCLPTEPAQVGAFTFVDANGTLGNANNFHEGCLGDYDNGPEEIFVWTVPAGGGTYSVTLTSVTTYGGVAVSNDCEATNCVAFAGSPALVNTIPFQFYAAGNYFIFVDNYAPYPDYLADFTLTVAVPPLTGACCYNSGASCQTVTEAQCTMLGGEYFAGEDCAAFTCPIPCPFPNRDLEPNDVCGDAQEVFCRESYCGTILSSADYDYYKLVIAEANCFSLAVNIWANDSPGHWPYGQGLDSKLWIYGPDDCLTQILYNDDNNGVDPFPIHYDSRGVTSCLAPGTYWIKVGGYGAGPYVMELVCTPCVCPGMTDCSTFVLCGSPAEVEPNDACPAPAEQTVIGCDMTVYGLHCLETDHDYWQVVVPAGNQMTLMAYQGANCDVNPTTAIAMNAYDEDCVLLNTTPSTTDLFLSNPETIDWIVYVDVFGTNITTYKLEATCCPIEDYLTNPIVIDVPSSSFEQTVNTCCATSPIDTIGGYASGPDVIFYHCGGGTWTFTAASTGDPQLIVFDADFNILGEADNGGAGTSETLTLTIDDICWYVGVSIYGAGSCGDITLTIEGDTWLPVELTSFDAVSSDRAVTLNWATASENDNDYYRVLRSGENVGEVNASGTVTGGTYTYTDNGLTNGTSYDYSVVAVSMSGEAEEVFAISATPSFSAATISEYALHQNFPNPFNPETKITFDLVDAGFVTLSVYNLLGQEVSTLVNSSMDAGRHIVSFDANNLPSGLYLYRMEVNGFSAQKKMVLMK